MVAYTPAFIGVDEIDTCALVEAHDVCAFVDIDLAVVTPKPRLALTLVIVDLVETFGAVLTWL